MLQKPEQHGEGPGQKPPSGVQLVGPHVNVLGSQSCAQQSFDVMHGPPSPTQLPTVHTPPLQMPLQQVSGVLHAVPFGEHCPGPQVPSLH